MERKCTWCGEPFANGERRFTPNPWVSNDIMHGSCVARSEAGHLPPPVVRALGEAANGPAPWSFTASPTSLAKLRAFAEGKDWTDPVVQAEFVAKERDKT